MSARRRSGATAAELLKSIQQQRRWITLHGGDKAGYLAYYGAGGSGIESGATIYYGDRAYLESLETEYAAEYQRERRRAVR